MLYITLKAKEYIVNTILKGKVVELSVLHKNNFHGNSFDYREKGEVCGHSSGLNHHILNCRYLLQNLAHPSIEDSNLK